MYTPTHEPVNPAIADDALNNYADELARISFPDEFDHSEMVSVYVALSERGLL